MLAGMVLAGVKLAHWGGRTCHFLMNRYREHTLRLPSMTATLSLLEIDPELAVSQITTALRAQLASTLKRRGLVVGMSGGIDSSLCAALALRAVGPKRVLGLFMPERESDPESLLIARSFANELGIEST